MYSGGGACLFVRFDLTVDLIIESTVDVVTCQHSGRVKRDRGGCSRKGGAGEWWSSWSAGWGG
jgi:hypothetical protein